MKQYVKSILTGIMTTTVATTAIVGGMCALNQKSDGPGMITVISDISSISSQAKTTKPAKRKAQNQNRVASNNGGTFDMSQPTFQATKKASPSVTAPSTTFVVATTPVSGSGLNTQVSRSGAQSASNGGSAYSSTLYASSRVPRSSVSAGHSVSLQEPFADERPTSGPRTKIDLGGGKDEPFYEPLDGELWCLLVCCACFALFIGIRRRKQENQL